MVEESEGVGDGLSGGGIAGTRNEAAMLRGLVGVVGFGGKRRNQTGVSSESRLAAAGLSVCMHCLSASLEIW